MAYQIMRSYEDGMIIGASDMNRIKSNFDAGDVAKFTTKGDIFAAIASQAGMRLGAGANGSWYYADSSATPGITTILPNRIRAYDDGSASAATPDAWTKVAWVTNETYDPAAAYATSRFTAQHPGYYLVALQNGFNLAVLGVGSHTKYEFALYRNGVKRSIIAAYYFQNRRQQYYWMRGIDIVWLARGDYLEVYYYIDNHTTSYNLSSFYLADAVHLDIHPLH